MRGVCIKGRINLFLLFFSIAFFSCEEDSISSSGSTQPELENTLDDVLSGQQGNVLDYFYELSSDAINAEYHYYDANAIANPQFFFEPSTDRLNFYSFPCYLVSLTQDDLNPELTTRSLQDSSTMHIEQEVPISSDRYSNIIKMVWNEEDARYAPQIQSNLQQDTTYTYVQDVGLDGCLDIFEAGDGSCLESENPDYDEDANPDPNGDNYSESDNPSGTQGDGLYNNGNDYTDIYNQIEYKVNYDIQEMGDIEGMYYLDTDEWVSSDSTYSSSQYTFEHRFIIEKDVISQDQMMWRINADCNENNALDSEPESYVLDVSGCNADEIFIEDPEDFNDYGADGCTDAFEDGNGACQDSANLGPDGCADPFEDGNGGCLDSPNPNYISGDPNGDNDNNSDNYDADSNNSGTEGNGQYDVGEEWFDRASGTAGYDTGFCDRTNQIWDSAEAHLDLEDEPDGSWDDIEPFQDRNCNEEYDSGEVTDQSEGVNQTVCENTLNGIWIVGAEFGFCDLGNGVWDDAEVCQDGSSDCDSREIYTISDKPNSLVVSYSGTDGSGAYDGYSAFDEVILDDDVFDRWGNEYSDLIETIQDTSFKFATVDLIDSVVVVLSNPIIEQLETPSTDYHIAKSEWYDDGVRDYDYHIFKQGQDDGYIYKLVHRSYFLPPGFYDAFSEGGFWFEENATDEVFLYTVGGYLRDGERYQTTRIDTTAIAEYLVDESYYVDYEPVSVPMRSLLGQLNDGGEVLCAAEQYTVCDDCSTVNDCSADTTFDNSFKVTREKTTTMLGTGVEYFERNITYFVENYGIVKDDLEFRWNTAPGGIEDLDGRYRWEMISNEPAESDCSEEVFLRTLVNTKEKINLKDFDRIDDFKQDSYKKTKTYGVQRVSD